LSGRGERIELTLAALRGKPREVERINDGELARASGIARSAIRKLSAEGEIPTAAFTGASYTFNLERLRFWIRKGGLERLRPPPAARTGFIYAVQLGSMPRVKIGFTKDVERRMPGIQTGAHEKLVLLHSVAGTTTHEAALKQRFEPYKTHGEWFRLEGDVAAWIEEGCPL
jgi:hypothetical protein